MESDETFTIQKVSAQQLLMKEFSMVQRVILGNVIQVGYQSCNDFMQSSKIPLFLKMERASKLIPEIKNMAVEYALMQACNKQLIPLKWSLEQTNNIALKYLKLKSLDGKCIFTVNQTSCAGKRSRHAKFREELDLPFQSSLNLFPNDDTHQFIVEPDFAYYCEINHGYRSETPLFAVVGKPAAQNGWLGQLSLLGQIQLLPKSEADDTRTAAEDLRNFNLSDFQDFMEEHK
ncbi:hypothetical protein FC07_GL000573 [Loigolactobacillus bifermentans DSM 20003]|jgi:hypothetical protein|uniref:Uncharacterized protein n=2 Tax=Loigolactobacillus bifermentans TaxID=1607 RepID=A0A0R1GJW5_9LACO|nr:hypothetical protein FC07_GL000573 [Loigolactobacillus bifermentans DSM 20003]